MKRIQCAMLIAKIARRLGRCCERSEVRGLIPQPPATLAIVGVPAISHGSSLLLLFFQVVRFPVTARRLGVLTSVLAVITALARRLGSKRDARIIRENRLRAFNTFPSISSSSSPTGGSRCYSKLTVPAPYRRVRISASLCESSWRISPIRPFYYHFL